MHGFAFFEAVELNLLGAYGSHLAVIVFVYRVVFPLLAEGCVF